MKFMIKPKRCLLGLILAVAVPLMHVGSMVALAQPTASIAKPVYFTAPDRNGVRQVYQWRVEGSTNKPRQITNADKDVVSFGVAYDGLSVAYISDKQLWRQVIDAGQAPLAVASLTVEVPFGSPVYSPDNLYIAYPDDGVWLYALKTEEKRRLTENVPVLPDGSNIDKAVSYSPERFVLDSEGNTTKLLLTVSLWEWLTIGVYDLATGALQQLTNAAQTSALPLADGRMLVYGNSDAAGDPKLLVAADLDDINTVTEVLDFGQMRPDGDVFAEQAAEIAPGVVRIFGQSFGQNAANFEVVIFDVHVTSRDNTEPTYFTVATGKASGRLLLGPLSPDGQYVAIYKNIEFTVEGTRYDELILFSLRNGRPHPAKFPKGAGELRWQP